MQRVDGPPPDMAEAELEETAQARLEAEIAALRAGIATLKRRLVHSFDEPGGFVAIGDELRQATERLRLLEAELKTRKLEARQEVWWTWAAAPQPAPPNSRAPRATASAGRADTHPCPAAPVLAPAERLRH